MKDKRCEPVRRELEESMLNEGLSTAAAEHLPTCEDCRELQRQHSRLLQIVGSLGTVNAPADFDFRLRARLAASEGSGFRFRTFAVKGLATAAILVVFGVGVAVVWQREKSEQPIAETTQSPKVAVPAPEITQPASDVTTSGLTSTQTVAVNDGPKRKPEHAFVVRPKRLIGVIDSSSIRAPLYGNAQPAMYDEPVFPIDASLQSLKVSLDDGRGNARTISFPTVSFGSQRVLTTPTQFTPKGVW